MPGPRSGRGSASTRRGSRPPSTSWGRTFRTARPPGGRPRPPRSCSGSSPRTSSATSRSSCPRWGRRSRGVLPGAGLGDPRGGPGDGGLPPARHGGLKPHPGHDRGLPRAPEALRQRGDRPPGLPPPDGRRRERGRGQARPGAAVQGGVQGAGGHRLDGHVGHPQELHGVRPAPAREGELPGHRDPRRRAGPGDPRLRPGFRDPGLPLRVPDALRPAPEARGAARGRRPERPHLRSLRLPLVPLLLPPPARAQGERVLRDQEPAGRVAGMKAVVYRGPNDLRVEEVPRPEPGPGEMLVRVEASGICGTDLKKIQKGLLSPPRIFGHEIAGTVVARGAGAPRFREGQRVVLHHHVPCGACFYCQRQAYAQCESYRRNGTTAGFEPSGGGYAEYVRAMDWIVARGAIPVPDGVLSEEAVFVEP